jgi:uncharacterized membrane protein
VPFDIRFTRRAAVWVGFALVHVWLAVLGVAIVPTEAFWDVDLYRWWMYLALVDGQWPVLDSAWVYPAGAMVPMLVPALASTYSTTTYAIGWCLLVTTLDGVATARLLRFGRRGELGAIWWLAFLAALGPVAMGRLDAIIAPLMVLALEAGVRRPRVAAALMTVGAWIKVAPGALLIPLLAAARRPIRTVIGPATVVCAAVVGLVAAGGGLAHLFSFLSTQTGRGLQVESVAATPWMVESALGRTDVVVKLNESLVTWEVIGPGTAATARMLDVVLALAIGAVAGLLWWASRQGKAGAAFLPGALLVLITLVVVNKVGSPQYLTWLAPPMALLLASQRVDRWLGWTAGAVLVGAGLTQVLFPWGYLDLLQGSPFQTVALVARNVLEVAVLVLAVVGVVRAARTACEPDPDTEPSTEAAAPEPEAVGV